MWRVRPSVRSAAVLVSALLTVAASPAMEELLNPEGLPPADQVVGYVIAAASVAATWLLAFRPHVRLSADGTVEVRNALGTTSFRSKDVEAVAPTPYGVQFVLRDGRRVTTIAFQDTGTLSGEPRWIDLAEAVTGTRPPNPHWHGHDDDYRS